jgi:hypothetical protein
MYGPEGMTTRTVYLKDRVVQTMGGGKNLMTQALAALQGGATGAAKTATTQKGTTSETTQGGMQATRKMLDDKPNIVLMLDIAGFAAAGAEVAGDSGAPIPVDSETLKKIAGKPSYIGFSLQCSADSLHTTTVIPVAQMKAIAQMVGVVLPAVGFGPGGGR